MWAGFATLHPLLIPPLPSPPPPRFSGFPQSKKKSNTSKFLLHTLAKLPFQKAPLPPLFWETSLHSPPGMRQGVQDRLAEIRAYLSKENNTANSCYLHLQNLGQP